MADGTLNFDTKLDSSGFEEGAGKLGAAAQSALGVFAGNLMTKAADAVVGLGKSALESGTSFETASAKTKTLFTGTDQEFKSLQGTMIGLSSASGLSADSIAEAAYSAESASVSAEDLGTMLEQSSKLAAAGFTDMDTALSATAKTMNAYGMSGEESIGKVQKVLMQTQNLGITTVGELGASLAQVTPTAAAFGVSFEQVGASLAVMTAQGTPTAQATTQLNSLLSELGKTGTTAANNLEEAAQGSKYAGMSFTEMMNSGATLDEVLGLLQAQADKNGVSMIDMFSSIEAGKSAMSIASQSGETFRKDLQGMSTDADVVGDAYATVSDTLEFKSQQIKTSMSNIATSLYNLASGPLGDVAGVVADALAKISDGLANNGIDGFISAVEEIAPALTPVIEGLRSFIDFVQELAADIQSTCGPAFQNLVQAGQDLMDAFANVGSSISDAAGDFDLAQAAADGLSGVIQGIADVIGFLSDNMDILIPVVAGLTGAFVAYKASMAIVGIIQGVQGALTAFKTAQEASTIAQAALNAVMNLNPFVLIATLIAGVVVALVALWNTNEGFRAAVTTAWEAISSVISAVVGTIVNFFTVTIPGAISAVIVWFQNLPGNILNALMGVISSLAQWSASVVGWIASNVPVWIDNIVNFFAQLPGKIWKWLVNTVTKVVQWGTNMVSKAGTAMSDFLSKVVSWMQQLPGKMWQFLSQAAQKVVTWGSDLARKGASAASGLFNAIVNGLRGLPGQMASIGRNIVNGIWNGISSGWSWLTSKVSHLASSLLNSAKKALGIGSPSRAFRDEVGKWILPGVEVGMEKTMPQALKSMRQNVGALVNEAQRSVAGISANMSLSASGAAGMRAAMAGGTTVYYDQHVDQTNTYQVPVASPSEVARTQRQAVRNLVGGVS